MKRFKKILLSKGVTAGALAVAIGLLAFSGIGTARAVLSVFSETYTTELQTSMVSVELKQNCEIDKDTKLVLGKEYKDNLSAYNSGETNEYVRVTIYKYWTNKEGEKCTVDPDLIGLHLVGIGDVWTEDTASALENNKAGNIEQRTVLYCRNLVPAKASIPFADTLTISDEVKHLDKITQVPKEGNETEIITSYDYDGLTYHIDVEVDAVQEHNATAAIKSAWGVDASAFGINVTE